MTIHDRIKDLRIGINKTQQESANSIGVKRSTWANWESDIVPPADMVRKLADFFEVSTDYLLNGTSSDLLPGGKVAIYVENDKLVDISELPPEIRQQVLDYIKFIKTQYINKK